MKILFLFTGGTIGSTVHGGFIGTDRKKPYLLLESYRKKYGIDFEFEAESPYTSLSENNTGSTIHTLCACVGARNYWEIMFANNSEERILWQFICCLLQV